MQNHFGYQVLLVCVVPTTGTGQRTMLIQSVHVINTSDSKAFKGSVRIQDSFKTEVGNLQPLPTDSVIDGTNLVLAMGWD
jgi:hypothetical protein